MIAKGLMILDRVSRAQVSVLSVQDGLQIIGQVEMAPPAAKK